jgi:hypothetical protein
MVNKLFFIKITKNRTEQNRDEMMGKRTIGGGKNNSTEASLF